MFMKNHNPINRLVAEINCVCPVQAVLGESPCWDYRSQELYWLDIKSSCLHVYLPESGSCQSWDLPSRVCSLDVPHKDWLPPSSMQGKSFIVCGDTGLAWLGIEEKSIHIHPISVSNPEKDIPHNRFNDGKMGPDGRYWAGTMDENEELESGRLYAFNPDGSFDELDSGYKVTNGPAFSPDGTTVYHTDSARREVYAFDIKTDGSLVHKRTLIRYAENDGCPDGMTTDKEGNLWIAIWDGARIEKVSSGGECLGAIRIPTGRPTSCIFAGPDCSEMFVTSASIGLENDALAGGLFRVVIK